jgi:hypothetical protein
VTPAPSSPKECEACGHSANAHNGRCFFGGTPDPCRCQTYRESGSSPKECWACEKHHHKRHPTSVFTGCSERFENAPDACVEEWVEEHHALIAALRERVAEAERRATELLEALRIVDNDYNRDNLDMVTVATVREALARVGGGT